MPAETSTPFSWFCTAVTSPTGRHCAWREGRKTRRHTNDKDGFPKGLMRFSRSRKNHNLKAGEETEKRNDFPGQRSIPGLMECDIRLCVDREGSALAN